ncbi:MAG: amidase [Alphaproteobacteria bacterium]|nr:amidase [Alphaproteobacteria bacterium]
MSDLHWMSASALAEAYRARQLSPVEVTRAALDRLAALNPRLNAFYLVDEDGAMKAAGQSEARWMQGAEFGPLDGVPTSAKDALSTIGWVTYRGSGAHQEPTSNPDSDAPAIARQREQGMVLLGKTTMPDFGILASGYSSKHGVTRNPWNQALNCGGSSSGAAVSVAAGIAPLAVGTDIVGSIRLPASFCGLYGLKPSQGRVPYYPPNDPALAAGPMSRNVADAVLLMQAIGRPDQRDFTALPPSPIDYAAAMGGSVAGARVGWLDQLGFGTSADAEVIQIAGRAARIFEGCGCALRPISLAFAPDELAAAETYYRTRCYAEFMKFTSAQRDRAVVIRDWTASISRVGARELFDAMQTMRRMRERVVRLFDDLDFLLLPSVHIPPFAAELPAPDADALFAPWINTFLFNITEQPAASVPCGLTAAGAPVGLQIVGRRFDDEGVIGMSSAFERMSGPFPMPDEARILGQS